MTFDIDNFAQDSYNYQLNEYLDRRFGVNDDFVNEEGED